MFKALSKSQWLLPAILFAFCIAPTFISYQPYIFGWDDSDYLLRSIAVSRAYWSGNIHGVIGAMVSIRPPAMTLLGLPWGPLESWDAASKCFITLGAVVALLAASCLYLLLRIGVKPVFLVAASVCVFASMGPYPHRASAFGPYPPEANAHWAATAFLADSLFAWTGLATVLLISYEARTKCTSVKGSILRGILWGAILSLGAMTKVNFLYFVVLVVPVLFLIRLHYGGLRSALTALIAFACWSAPSVIYLVRFGGPAFNNAKASSFGRVASFYYIPLGQFLGATIRESPGLVFSFVLMAAAVLFLVIRRREIPPWPDCLALLIMIGFAIIVLAATNKQIRYAFPAIVALPFLMAILMSGKGHNEHSVPGRSAALAAAIVFCSLLAASVPMRHRAARQSLDRADAVLAQAARCKAKHIALATDSPTLNQSLMELASEVSTSGVLPRVSTLAYNAMLGSPIGYDFRWISVQDQVIFQDKGALFPAFTNQRAQDYERAIRQAGYVPVRAGDDVSVYSLHCSP